MPRAVNAAIQNKFIRGLITEATGLSFPEDACVETYNCIFDQTGLVSRRLGFDFEEQYEPEAVDLDSNVKVSYLWKNVADTGDISFVVVQTGQELRYYQVGSGDSLSASIHAHTTDLTDYLAGSITDVSQVECQFSSGNGLLFVTNPNLETFYVAYDPDANTFSEVELTLKIRDLKGDAADGLAIDERTTSTLAGLSAAHHYNLRNQGWTNVASTGTLQLWDTARTDMPSNCDVAFYYKSTADAYDFSLVAQHTPGNSPAPKGHFVYSLYDIDRSTNVSSATDEEITDDRVSTSAFFAGRVFYSGLKTDGWNSKIFFTQIVEEPTQYAKCYQTNDPTSEELFDLLPSDGGVIDLLEAGTILKMVPVLNSLICFCTNGVWAITGSQGIGFTANDYSINKIYSGQNLGHTSFVEADGIPYWWTFDGILTIELDRQTNSIRVVNITDNTIKTFYDSISLDSKPFVRGTYDTLNKEITWLYRNAEIADFGDRYVFDSMLTFKLLTKAFSPWQVSVDNVKIHSVVNMIGLSAAFQLDQVVNGADTVVDSGDNVIVFTTRSSGITSTVKFLVSYEDSGTQLTFAENNNDGYIDWETFDDVGESYNSYFETGYMLHGQGQRKFQANYVHVFCQNLVDSSFVIRGQWNYGFSESSNRWSEPQTLSITANNFSHRIKRVKIRGHGQALQLRFSSNSNDPFNLVGWTLFETVNKWV